MFTIPPIVPISALQAYINTLKKRARKNLVAFDIDSDRIGIVCISSDIDDFEGEVRSDQ